MLIWSLAAEPAELREGWLHIVKLCQDERVAAGRDILKKLEQTGPPVGDLL